MKITPINLYHQSFKSNYVKMGYDDSVSEERRKYIREHYNPIPYYDVLENNGRLEEYELNKLMSSFIGKQVNTESMKELLKNKQTTLPKQLPYEKDIKPIGNSVNYDLMYSLDYIHLRPILNSNSYRGATADITPRDMKTLAKAGIKRVIALMYLPYDSNTFKKRGLEYKNFSDIDKMFDVASFDFNKLLRMEVDKIEASGHFVDKQEMKSLEHKMQVVQKTRETNYINDLIDFIVTMQKENVYIGCSLGTYRTDNALMINHFFNPRATKTPDCLNNFNNNNLYRIRDFYYKLNDSMKKQMGWTVEFDEAFLPKIEKLIKDFKI